MRNLINTAQVSAVHDVSDGGLGLAVIEMALAAGLGASLLPLTHEQLFGEDQARYVVTCAPPRQPRSSAAGAQGRHRRGTGSAL